MPKSEEELLERDAGRDIGGELLESLRELRAGEATATHSPVAIARYRVKMSQSEFAKLLGGLGLNGTKLRHTTFYKQQVTRGIGAAIRPQGAVESLGIARQAQTRQCSASRHLR